MRFRKKIIVASLITTAAALLSIHYPISNILHTPYLFGFVTEQPHLEIDMYISTIEYIENMHNLSLIFIYYADILYAITGNKYTWYFFPGIIAIAPLIYALLEDLPQRTHTLATAASTLGPAGVFAYTFTLSRDAVDTAILLSLLLVFLIAPRFRTRDSFISLSAGAASIILWLNHYSYWPLFAFITGVFVVLSGYRRKVTTVALVGAPAGLYFLPFTPYIGSIRYILFDPKRVVAGFFSTVQSLPAGYSVVSPIREAVPHWMPEYQFLAFAAVIGIFLLIYLIAVLYAPTTLRQWITDAPYQSKLAISVGIGCSVYTLLLFLRGYLLRAFIIWPIVIPFFILELSRAQSVLASKFRPLDDYSAVVVAFCILIVVISMAPLAAPTYFESAENPSAPSSQQEASGKWATYADSVIYTDLVHANEIILHTGKRKVAVGVTMGLTNGSIGVSPQAQPMTGEWDDRRGLALVTIRNKLGVRMWGGALPPQPDVTKTPKCHIVYSNGQDVWCHQAPSE